MATRFGAASPARAYAAKMRWLIGCLVIVILVLVAAIMFLAQSGVEPQPPQAPVDVPAPEVQQKTVDILYAATRVEEGTKLEPQMFKALPMDADQLPMAAIRSQDGDKVYGKFAARLINANMPLVADDFVAERPVNSFNIPPGYRAITISVDVRAGVEGFARPNTRVDVLWTYTQENKKKVATIARFIKILSVAGQVSPNGEKAAVTQSTPITLLVTERDAKKIELARGLGELSLSLVGEHESAQSDTEPDAVSIADLIGQPAAQPAQAEPVQPQHDGVMYTSDPHTGRQVRYVLVNGRWSLDRSFGGAE